MPRVGMQPVTGHNIFYRGLVSFAPFAWGKPRIAAWWQSLANELAELETAAWQVLEARTLANADTTRLDVLGRLLGQPRFSTDNDVYRSVLQGKIAANRSRGLEDDLRRVVRLAAQTSLPITVTHLTPATVLVSLNEPITNAARQALDFLLPKTRAAGVRLGLLVPADANALRFDSSVTPLAVKRIDSSVSPIGAGTGTISSGRNI
jgi:hypothetical protein